MSKINEDNSNGYVTLKVLLGELIKQVDKLDIRLEKIDDKLDDAKSDLKDEVAQIAQKLAVINTTFKGDLKLLEDRIKGRSVAWSTIATLGVLAAGFLLKFLFFGEA